MVPLLCIASPCACIDVSIWFIEVYLLVVDDVLDELLLENLFLILFGNQTWMRIHILLQQWNLALLCCYHRRRVLYTVGLSSLCLAADYLYRWKLLAFFHFGEMPGEVTRTIIFGNFMLQIRWHRNWLWSTRLDDPIATVLVGVHAGYWLLLLLPKWLLLSRVLLHVVKVHVEVVDVLLLDSIGRLSLIRFESWCKSTSQSSSDACCGSPASTCLYTLSRQTHQGSLTFWSWFLILLTQFVNILYLNGAIADILTVDFVIIGPI